MSILGIDVGTTGCKVTALSVDGDILAAAYREYHVIRPAPGRAELNSHEVWGLIKECIIEIVPSTQSDPVRTLSVSSMGEAMTPVSKDREILGNCLLGFDTRGQETFELLRGLDQVAFFERSGNIPSGVMAGPKLIWQRDNWPELFEKTDKFLCWADLVAYLLGGDSAVADYSLVNRTLFFDIRGEKWSQETLDLVGMPREKLPDLAQAGTVLGTVSRAMQAELGLPPGVQIVLGAHDQCVNAVGAGVTKAGMAVLAMGTFVTINPTYDTIPPAEQIMKTALTVEHHALPGLYTSFYYNLTGGALLKWFRDTFTMAEHQQARAAGEDVYDWLMAEMPSEPTDLMVLPHFAPTGPPHYDEDARGLIAGLSLATSRGEFVKGLLEGVSYYARDGIQRMAAAGISINELRASGGGARSDQWLQLKADVLGQNVTRTNVTETTALGAAIIAGVGSGIYESYQSAINHLVQIDQIFEPDVARHRQYTARFERAYDKLYPFMQNIT